MRSLFRRAWPLAAAVALLGLFPTMSASASPNFNPPKHVYLALGDSEAFGFQEARFLAEVGTNSYNPATFDSGYVDDFAARLRALRPDMETVNYSCPGETSTTFIAGGCSFRASEPFALHNDYPVAESQLQAALGFLTAHPGEVSPITINLGANDIFALERSCAGNPDPLCVPKGLPGTAATLAANLSAILMALHRASPSSEIIVLNNADPYEYIAPASLPLFQVTNTAIAQAAETADARVVDLYGTAIATSPAVWCTLTSVCTPPLFDIHPTDAGYSLIAQLVWAASGYARLGG